MDSPEGSYLSTSLSWPYMTLSNTNLSEQNLSESKSHKRVKTENLQDSGGTSNGNNRMRDILIYIVKSFSPNTESNKQMFDDIISIQENDKAVSENIKTGKTNTPAAHANNLPKKYTSRNNKKQDLQILDNKKKEKLMNNEKSDNVKTKFINKSQPQKLKKSIVQQKKPVISFFDDVTSPSTDNSIEITNLSSFAMTNTIGIQRLVDCKNSDDKKTTYDEAKKFQRSSKSSGKDKNLKHNDMSKFTTSDRSKGKGQTEIKPKMTKEISSIRRTLNNETCTQFDSTASYENGDLPNNRFHVSFKEKDNQFGIMEQASEEKNEEKKAIKDGRQSYLGDKNEKDRCLETYWNRTDVSFKFISKVFNILPPSKKVFDSFVENTKKNTSRDMKSKRNGDSSNNATGNVLPLSYLDQKTNNFEQHNKCIEGQAQCSSTQKGILKRIGTQRSFSLKEESEKKVEKELCPDNMNMIKKALSQEIAKRFASTGHKDGICMEDFEKLVQEQVTNIINEIRANKAYLEEVTHGSQINTQIYNLSRSILKRSECIVSKGRNKHYSHVGEEINDLQKEHLHFSKEHRKEHQSYEKPKSRATKSAPKQARTSISKLDNVNIEDYNRDMKLFQQNLLKTDSDCSVLDKKNRAQKGRMHHLKKSRITSKIQNQRKEAHSKVREKSHEVAVKEREIILKNRRHEVEEKLKNSKKRTRPLHEKKERHQTDRIREITHQKLKLGTKKANEKNPQTNCYEPGNRKNPDSKREPRMIKKRTKCLDTLFDTIASSFCSKKDKERISISKEIHDKNKTIEDTYENHSSDSNKTLAEHDQLSLVLSLKDASNESISNISEHRFSIKTEDIVFPTKSEESYNEEQHVFKNQENEDEIQDNNMKKLNNTTVQYTKKRPNSKKQTIPNISLTKSENSLTDNDAELKLTLSEQDLVKIMITRRNEILKLKEKNERKL